MSNNNNRGKLYIGKKRVRGIKGDKNATRKDVKNLDVTSGSNNKIKGIKCNLLSPFYTTLDSAPILDEKGHLSNVKNVIFENYWQGGKVYQSHIKNVSVNGCIKPTPNWYKFRLKTYNLNIGKRRPLPRREYGSPVSSIYTGYDNSEDIYYDIEYDYIDSRKDVYVPIYYNLLLKTQTTKNILKGIIEMLNNGHDVMIIDVDGPPKDEYPQGAEFNLELWNEMINRTDICFGHGYIICAILSNFRLSELV